MHLRVHGNTIRATFSQIDNPRSWSWQSFAGSNLKTCFPSENSFASSSADDTSISSFSFQMPKEMPKATTK